MKRSHDKFPVFRNELVEQRTIVLKCMREVAEKLERGFLDFDHALSGAGAAVEEMMNIVDRARAELED